ncbi:MAG: cob(I)yrinic acid a,c-diamide adenosyltransferase [Sedimentisphaerales bacterium]|nr:cob(I)yrinic acid a,c-diamide adenosyltransferase [Sedimentisphaerales bacterium]
MNTTEKPNPSDQPWSRGYVQVYTGDGKGKTTAAIGLALRAAGAGLNIYIAQFAKTGDYSELRALDRFAQQITLEQFGTENFIVNQPTPQDIQAAQQGLHQARQAMLSGKYHIIILDEANIATHFQLFTVEELLDFIDAKPTNVELVITGRRADPRVIQKADLVTEMRQVKHYYQQNVKARPGIES